MKILLSWLQRLRRHRRRPRRAGETRWPCSGCPSRTSSARAAVDGVVTARVVRTERIRTRPRSSGCGSTPATARARHVWCGAFNFAPGDVVPLAPIGTTLPDGRTIARRAHPRHRLRGDALLGPRAAARRRPHRHPRAARRLAARRAVRRGARPPRRRRARPRRHAQPPRLPGRTSASPATSPPSSARPLRADAAAVDVVRRRPAADHRRDRRRRPLRPLHLDRPVGRRRRPVGAVDGRAAGGRRHATDQQRRRRQQLRDARAAANPTTPTTWTRSAGTGSASAWPAPASALTTLDGIERTLTADDLLICDAEDRPIGLAGIMGGTDTEISAATTTVALEMAWFAPVPIGQSVARLGLRSEASARYERGVDPYGIDTVDRPVRRAAAARRARSSSCTRAPSMPAATPCRRPSARRTVRIAQVNRILGTSLAADDLPALLDPIGFTRVRRRRRANGRPPVVAARQRRRRSTSSRRSPGSTATTASASGCRRRSSTATCRCAQQRRRQLRQVLLGLGITEVMPNPFLAPDTLARAGLDGDALRITNPLVAEESVLRTSLRPGLLRAVAFNESHRRPGVALFEIGHVYPPGQGELPDEYEALGRRARRRGGAGGDGRVAGGRRGDGRSAPASTRAVRRPACTRRARPRSSPAATRSAPSARSRRTSSRRSGSPSGWRCSSSTCGPCSTSEPQPARWQRDEPPAVERPRPRLRPARRRAGRAARQGDPPGCRRPARRPRAVRRLPRPGWPTDGAAWPTASACRRRTAASPTPTSPRCARR